MESMVCYRVLHNLMLLILEFHQLVRLAVQKQIKGLTLHVSEFYALYVFVNNNNYIYYSIGYSMVPSAVCQIQQRGVVEKADILYAWVDQRISKISTVQNICMHIQHFLTVLYANTSLFAMQYALYSIVNWILWSTHTTYNKY